MKKLLFLLLLISFYGYSQVITGGNHTITGSLSVTGTSPSSVAGAVTAVSITTTGTGAVNKMTGSLSVGTTAAPSFTLEVDGLIAYNSPHAAITMVSSATYTPSLTQNVPLKIIPGMTTIEVDGGIVRQDDTLQLPVGHYWVTIDGDFATNNNNDIQIECRINNTARQKVYRGSGTSTSNFTPIMKSWYVTVTGSAQWLSFYITNLTNNDDPVIRDFGIHVQYEPER